MPRKWKLSLLSINHAISKANIAFTWVCFFIIHIVICQTVILFTWNLLMTYCYWISKLLQQKIWLVNTLIVTDRYPQLGWASKNLMNHPWPEKSQPVCLSSSRSKWNVMIARMKAHISNLLCPVRHVACTSAWQKRKIIFWSIICSFPTRFHSLSFTF